MSLLPLSVVSPASLIALVVAIGVVVFVLVVRSLSREATSIHSALRAMKERAKRASAEELRGLRSELVAFHNEHCWHRHFGAHAREVLSYIDRRISSAAR